MENPSAYFRVRESNVLESFEPAVLFPHETTVNKVISINKEENNNFFILTFLKEKNRKISLRGSK